MDPEAGEAPTPASAVDLRKPLRMTALYLVTFTALLVGASLAPTADAVDKPAVASARRVMEAPEPRPSALSRVVAPLERDQAVRAPPADELSPAAVAVGGDGGGEGDAPSSSSLPECAFHVYRHLSKTGGTTVRFVFDKQTAMGEWEYPLSYGFDEAQWTALLARWRAAARAWRAGDRAEGPRTLVEVRGNWPSNWPAENFERVLADVATLKEEFGDSEEKDAKSTCRVTTSAMLREPAAQYLSFYDYYIRKHQEAIPNAAKDRDKRWPDVPGRAAWGADAGEWAARVPNMQTREMLGDKCTPQMRQPGYDVVWPAGESAPTRRRRAREGRRVRDDDAVQISIGSRRCCVPSTSSASQNDSTSFSSRSRTSPACDTSRTSNRTRARRVYGFVDEIVAAAPGRRSRIRRRRHPVVDDDGHEGARTRVASDGRTRGATVRRRGRRRGGEEGGGGVSRGDEGGGRRAIRGWISAEKSAQVDRRRRRRSRRGDARRARVFHGRDGRRTSHRVHLLRSGGARGRGDGRDVRQGMYHGPAPGPRTAGG